MNELVSRLFQGQHEVEVRIRPNKSPDEFEQCIQRGYVHLNIADTRGGTELGIRLDKKACDLGGANFREGSGNARLAGALVLDGVRMMCTADISLPSLSGLAVFSQHSSRE
jgi:hypothetical protein